MEAFLSKFDAGELIGLVAVGGGLLCAIVGIFMGCWLEMSKTASATSLKHEMLERGMSAEEIRTVLDAGTAHSLPGSRRSRSCCA